MRPAAPIPDTYRELLEQFGTTEFTGYTDAAATARVVAVLAGRSPRGGRPPDRPHEIFLDRTPFYAEGAARSATPA